MKIARKKEWFDDDSFWREFYPIMFSEERFAAAVENVDKIIRLTKLKGKAVLDLCCGPGRYAVPFAKHKFAVTGVDKTKYLLDKAKAKARKAKVKIEWIQQDMRDFVRPDSFDLVLNLFTSFGYFDDKKQDMIVLQNILASLHRGGIFLIDTIGKERLAKIFQPATFNVLPDGTKLIECREVFDNWTRMRNEWILIRRGRAKSYRFHHTIFSGQELRDRLEQVGFVGVKLYGNLSGDDYGPEAQRLIAVARKP
jgi:SAM-dependent methyltransferase